MKLKDLASLAILAALLSLIVACSKSQTDAPQAVQPSEEATSEGPNAPIETVPPPPALQQDVASVRGPFLTHMNCKVDAAVAAEIRQLETMVATLRLQLTDKHPGVVRLKETIRQLKEDTLGQCLERDSTPRNCDVDATVEARIRAVKEQLVNVDPVDNGHPNPVYLDLKIQLIVDVAKADALAKCERERLERGSKQPTETGSDSPAVDQAAPTANDSPLNLNCDLDPTLAIRINALEGGLREASPNTPAETGLRDALRTAKEEALSQCLEQQEERRH